jgi:hypothetical protein
MTEQIDMFKQMKLYINSRIPVIWLVTSEEGRAERGIAQYARNLEWQGDSGRLGIWSLTGGVNQGGGWSEFPKWREKPIEGQPLPDEFFLADPIGAKIAATPNGGLLIGLNWAVENPAIPCLLVVRDAHCFLKNDYFRRVLKDAELKLRGTLTTIICISITAEVPHDIKRNLAFIKPGLPTLKALQKLIKPTLKKLKLDISCYDCAAALRGLNSQQANDLIMLDFSKHGEIDITRLSKLKAKELASVHGVSFKGEASDFNNVGGFDQFKNWLKKRRHAFGQKARDAGIDKVKGALFVGVPGGGKTLMGSAAAGELGLPFIVANLAECEGGIVGETATRTIEALMTIDALSPCVILFDEIEKIFGGPGNRDGGSRSGMLRIFIIWLQERETESFAMLTANDISGLPPELSRRGRVDEIWWCDLPGKKDRKQIINIHLDKRNRSISPPAINSLANELDGFTGSEIEQVVKEAHLTAYCRSCENEDGNLTLSDLKAAANAITPLGVTYERKLAELRAWAKNRARPASLPDPEDKPRLVANTEEKKSVPSPGTSLFSGNETEAW